jgi:hypothetical protein
MTRRQTAVVLLAGALALLGASVAWAATRTPGDGHRLAYGPPPAGLGYTTRSASPVVGSADARTRAHTFADALGLRTGEVLRFERNYYVQLVDSAGRPATELLVDPASGAVGLEFGPAMMWNTRYGAMRGAGLDAMRGTMGRYGRDHGGPMGGGSGGTATGGVSLARARELAQAWLDRNEPGLEVEAGGDAFPGYFTLETLREGRIAGMISVNAATGAVWPHWWHGAFVEAAG